jgi:hypothetical protein
MHGANGVASLVLRAALQRCVPCQMESLGCILGTDTLSPLHTVERDAYQPRRTGHPKCREPW